MEFTGKTVDEAIENGLKQLGIEKDDALITVIEEPVKGLFGKLKGDAKVSIISKDGTDEIKEETVGENVEIKAGREKEFLEKLLEILNIPATLSVSVKDGNEVITIKSESQADVIGYRGEMLDAIQTLTGAVANIGEKEYNKIVVDCENYRGRREETLIKLAKKLEEKAVEMKREVWLEPMNPFERRIIHTTLADSDKVTTKSDGKEPNRFVIIVPNEKDEYSRPYNAGVNHGDREHKNNFRKNNHGGQRRNTQKRGSGFTEQRKKTASGFGTYLGNSKDFN